MLPQLHTQPWPWLAQNQGFEIFPFIQDIYFFKIPILTKFWVQEKFMIAKELIFGTYIVSKPYQIAFKWTTNIVYLPAKEKKF